MWGTEAWRDCMLCVESFVWLMWGSQVLRQHPGCWTSVSVLLPRRAPWYWADICSWCVWTQCLCVGLWGISGALLVGVVLNKAVAESECTERFHILLLLIFLFFSSCQCDGGICRAFFQPQLFFCVWLLLSLCESQTLVLQNLMGIIRPCYLLLYDGSLLSWCLWGLGHLQIMKAKACNVLQLFSFALIQTISAGEQQGENEVLNTLRVSSL